MRHFLAAATILALTTAAAPAQSQGGTDFANSFAGQWQSYDPATSAGGICTITLEQLPVGGKLAARASNCAARLAAISQWEVAENQIVLADGSGGELARLGGNPRRLTGETADGHALILEARGGDGTAQALQSALNAAGCLYLGYTDKCAAPEDENKPAMSGSGARVKVLVDLNARTTPRSDARVLGIVKRDTCLVVNQCALASDGVWCRADFSGGTGWVKKLAIRQEKWPVVTFVNSC